MIFTEKEKKDIERIKINSMNFRGAFIDSLEHHRRQHERMMLLLNEADRQSINEQISNGK